MSYMVDILEPSMDNIEASANALGVGIGRLYYQHWEEHQKAKFGGKPFNLNIQSLVTGWMNGTFKVFVARDTAATAAIAGFLIGMRYRPMCYEVESFNIIDWYAPHPDMEKALFDYVFQALRILGATELIIPREATQVPPNWKELSRDTIIRYVRT